MKNAGQPDQGNEPRGDRLPPQRGESPELRMPRHLHGAGNVMQGVSSTMQVPYSLFTILEYLGKQEEIQAEVRD